LKLPSGSSQSVTVSLPSAPPENVTVTVTPSSGITATPTTLAFTPTDFSGKVTVGSTAIPGTIGTVKFSAPGYADGVVKVTVEQSTNLVVDPASLSIPANGAESFKVKLAKAPTAPVTVTVTPSTPDLTTTPAFLIFTPANFDINQTVLVSTGPGVVPGAQSVLLNAGLLGQFNLPVTITPASNTIFFIDPVNGDDTSPGTAAQPWRTVEKALDIDRPSGYAVATAANAGNNVVVTILDGVNVTQNASAINTPALSAGSVTVLQAPFKKTFTLNMGSNQLTLNKGYKLQDIRIKSSATGTAVLIAHPTAGLASVEVDCTTASGAVKCVKVEGSGSYTLKDVTVKVTANNTATVAIRNESADANLSIVGGEVQLTGGANAITLINSQGVLTVTGLTVDMTGGGHAQASTGIVLNAAGSSVTGSTIRVNNGPGGGSDATGIHIQHATGTSTVARNNFIGSGTNTIGIKGSSKLSPDSIGNNFSGIGTLFQ